MILSEKIIKLPIIWELRKFTLYSFYALKALWQFKSFSIIIASFKYFPVWWKHLKRDLNPLDCDRPWINFEAKAFLDTILNKQMLVFEYGSGSSTVYFSKRVKQITSIENDKNWFEHICAYIQNKNICNIDYKLIEGEQREEELAPQYSSSSLTYKNISFESYVKSIDLLADESLDIIVVDGRARNACIKHAADKLKKGGYLLLDNSNRKEYLIANEFLFDTTKWELMSFAGPVPYAFEFSPTSYFRKK